MKISSKRFWGLLVSASFGLGACQPDGGGTNGKIGASGGTVSTLDGVRIEIPQGALDSEVSITITEVTDVPPGALGPAFRFAPEGLTFKQPVQITLPYNPSPNLPPDATERVFVVPISAGATPGMKLPGTVVNHGQVQTETTDLTTYVAVKDSPTLVATQLDYPKGLALNSTHLYWTSGSILSQQAGGVVMRVKLGDGTPEILASGQPDPKHIALDSDYAYWTDGGSGPKAGDAGIMKVSLSGGMPSRIAPASFPIDIAVNARYVFWTDYDLHTINRAARDGSGQTVLATTGNRPIALSIDSSNVYWISSGTKGGHDGAVMQVSIEGGTPTIMAGGQAEPASLAVDATDVYWVNAGDGLVQSVPIAGGPAKVLRHMTRPNAIAVDNLYYYIGEVLPGMIIRYPKSGGTGDVRSSNEGHPNQIAVDGNNIYWINDGITQYQGDAQVINKSP